ncbi:MAG: sensor histidine kinase [Pseudohongiellaceae bacterium]
MTVADTGCGMPERIKEKVFEPFFTTKQAGKGTGLGLSSVLGIIQQHDGFVHLESVANQGTTLDVYLPLLNHESEAAGQAGPDERRQQVTAIEPVGGRPPD